MTAQGVQVTYFCSETSESIKQAVQDAGAVLRQPSPSKIETEDRMVLAFCSTTPSLIEDLRALEPLPDVIIYDPFYPFAVVVSEVLKIPRVAMIVNTGPGCSAPFESPESDAMMKSARNWFQDNYSVDIFQFGIPLCSFYSNTLNIALTDEAFFDGPKEGKQRELFGDVPFDCVGSLVDPKNARRPPMADFPLDTIIAARDAGKKVVLLSLGSEVTGSLWDRPFPGPAAQINDDGTEVDGKTLCKMTGKDVAEFVWKVAFEALGGDENLLVVMVTGGKEAALEGVPRPSNFLCFAKVPQLEVLPLCSAFITHGGMGSTMESFVFHVPVIVVPVFGDQVSNADNASKLKLGFGFRYPLKSLTAGALKESVSALLESGPENTYKVAVEAFASKMDPSRTAAKAINRIFSVVK
eukprot:TRINITY_DN10986_c0_g1_i1.p1 TRINITY_DN10986_c0_g1~~TRINITY_DN10986_c0_g1_i1.p1  ORF type:complete len:471 (-),score=65.21 TRINITY_DN10986_c0_g1_i1:264-1493(-)